MGRRYHERFTVEKVIDETKDIRRFVFDRALPSEPGQFVKLWIPRVGERPFSVLNDDPLELGIKNLLGPFTEKVFKLYKGQRVFIRGPYGRSFMPFVKPTGRKILVCGGCGTVPLDFLSKKIKDHQVIALVGARSKDEIPDLLKGIKTAISTDDGSLGYKGVVTELVEKLKIDREDQFFICGPEKMMAIAAEKAETKVPAENIILSLERYMKCGRGLCGSCELDGHRVCVDGPVFSYDQIKGGDFGVRKRSKTGRRVPV